jgi:hypothetical protein
MRYRDFGDEPILPPPPSETGVEARGWLQVDGTWWEAERAAERARARSLSPENEDARRH